MSDDVGSTSDLAGVEEVHRVEHVLQCQLDREDLGLQFSLHAASFEEPDAVFARYGAAKRDGGSQYLLEGGLRGTTCQVVVWWSEDQGVQVAVASVRDGRHPDAVSLADLLDGGQHGRDRRPWHADVLGEDRAQPLQRRIGEPSRDEQGFGLVLVVDRSAHNAPASPNAVTMASASASPAEPGVSI